MQYVVDGLLATIVFLFPIVVLVVVDKELKRGLGELAKDLRRKWLDVVGLLFILGVLFACSVFVIPSLEGLVTSEVLVLSLLLLSEKLVSPSLLFTYLLRLKVVGDYPNAEHCLKGALAYCTTRRDRYQKFIQEGDLTPEQKSAHQILATDWGEAVSEIEHALGIAEIAAALERKRESARATQQTV